MKKHIALLLCLALLICTLSGCGNRSEPSADDLSAQLTAPDNAQTILPYGENAYTRQCAAVFCYPNDNGSTFTTTNRILAVPYGKSRTQTTAELFLFNATTQFSANSELPALLSVEESNSNVTINLTANAMAMQGNNALCALIVSLSNTLLSLDGIEAVNVLVNHTAPEFSGIPMGVQTEAVLGTASALAHIATESELLAASPASTVERQALVYRPNGDVLIPETVSFDYNPGSAPLDLLTLTEMTAVEAHFTVDAAGRSLLNVSLDEGESAEWQRLAASTLTLCSFLPNLYGVQYRIDGQTLRSYTRDGQTCAVKDGIFRRETFATDVGTLRSIYLPDGDGLKRVDVGFSREHGLSMLYICRALFAGMRDFLPEGAEETDLKSVTIQDSNAILNLSADLYGRLQTMDEAREQCFVYAFVNTLCGFEGISSVQFAVEEMPTANLAGYLYALGVFLENPGIVHTQTEEENL